MPKEDKCPCGSSQYSYCLKGKKFSILKCNICELARTFPKPTPEYFQSHLLPRNEQEERGKRAEAQKILKEISLHKREGTILEIGSGKGVFLTLAKQSGYDPVGIEINPSEANYSAKYLGARVINEDVYYARITDTFDVIVMNFILNHMEDPLVLLKRMKEWLNPSGIIYITLANMDCPWKTLHGEAWKNFHFEEHYFHYTPKTLQGVLTRTGYRIKDIKVKNSSGSILSRPLGKVFEMMGKGDIISVVAEKSR